MKQRTRILIYILVAITVVIMGSIAILNNHHADKPVSAQEHIDLGHTYLIELSYDKAVIEFTEAIEIEPLNADAYLGIAEAYLGVGDTEKAIEWLEKGYSLTGDERLKNMIDELKAEDNEIVTNNDGSYYEMAFNADGKIIHEDFYDENGNYFGCADIEYYPNGNIKSETYYREDGSYYVAEYDINKKITKKINYNSDGSIDFYEVYEYDSNGNMLSNMSYYGDNSLRRYSKYKYDANNYEIYYEIYDSLRYRKETYTDENMHKEITNIWNVKYNNDYTIVYTYPIDENNGGLWLGGHNGIVECYSYYSIGGSYTHSVYEFNENNKPLSSTEYSYDNYNNSETYYGYTEYFYDKNGNEVSNKCYYKNYETDKIELNYYSIYQYDGLGNNILSTQYSKDGTILWQYKY